MKIKFASISKQGTKKPVNQDCFVVPRSEHNTQEKGFLFVVCDGVGGYKGGEIASKLCCKIFMNDFYLEEKDDNISNWLESEIQIINNEIVAQGIKLGNANMSTTLVSLLLKKNTAYLNNVGDSRIYIFTDDKLEQITEDHSVVWKYYKQGLITKDEIIQSRKKHLITEALGLYAKPKINSYSIPFTEKFLFLLCTDGLTDVCKDSEIENVLKQNNDLDSTLEELYNLSQKNGSRDDVTMVLIKSNPREIR